MGQGDNRTYEEIFGKENKKNNKLPKGIGYVTIKVVYNKDASFQDVIQEMDYNLKHPDIIKTEVHDIEFNEGDANEK